jgi:hypothetical protein
MLRGIAHFQNNPVVLGVRLLCFGYCLAGLQQTMHIIHKCVSYILALSLFMVISITADDIPMLSLLQTQDKL